MHEYSIVASLIDRVRTEVDARGASRVHSLRVDLGELSGVEPSLLTLAFDTFREGTVCDGATLEIRPLEAVWSCPLCARPLQRGVALRCPYCREPARLTQGDEIVLAQIEMEVSDV